MEELPSVPVSAEPPVQTPAPLPDHVGGNEPLEPFVGIDLAGVDTDTTAEHDVVERDPIQEIGKAHGVSQATIDEVKKDPEAQAAAERLNNMPPASLDAVTKAIEEQPKTVAGVTGERIKSFIERVERLEEEKAALSEDIKEIYAEAKATGFDIKTIRKLVMLRRIDAQKRAEEQELLELYASAIQLTLF